ncbi:PREDICTED: trafficking protein particle complex subunit 3-like isoform X2 [Nelumbo nucifera]|uniref:Trafficking protein particle complex subunit 3-like isoform X2 n=1 Tax=Nelumbo nucifera TaxID=4432 RepID=A0A1U8BCM2_NELNU|nr:PREDICTED: trafficking protein particle complex subunit 3-like isoform X2 [Nelumbo nucifera]
MAPPAPRTGDAVFANVERVNAELFTLTYGAIVRQLLTDLEEVEEVNKQLDQMGYNIGIRLIDEFLTKSNISRCVDFKETAEVIAKAGFKMFLGVTASVTNWDADGTSCSLVLEDNPLVDFVELPDTCQGLYYCNILSGVIRGALEMTRAWCCMDKFHSAFWCCFKACISPEPNFWCTHQGMCLVRLATHPR